MNVVRKPITWLGIAVLSLVSCSQPAKISNERVATAITSPSDGTTLVLADISDNPQKKIRKFQPLADYLAQNLDQFNQGQVKVAPDMETMITWLETGEVDIYIDSPYPAMLAMTEADAKPILRRWKKGRAEYSSYIFALKDSNLNSLTDLSGKKVAFDHPFSTTGYMLPKVELLQSGLNPVEQQSTAKEIPDNAVGYLFTDEDENSIEWVLSGKTDAAAVDNQAFEQIAKQIQEKLVILSKTEKIDRNLVMVRGNMSPKDIEAISEALLDMDDSPEGKKVLEQFGKTTKFDNFTGQESLSKIQETYQQLQSHEEGR